MMGNGRCLRVRTLVMIALLCVVCWQTYALAMEIPVVSGKSLHPVMVDGVEFERVAVDPKAAFRVTKIKIQIKGSSSQAYMQVGEVARIKVTVKYKGRMPKGYIKNLVFYTTLKDALELEYRNTKKVKKRGFYLTALKNGYVEVSVVAGDVSASIPIQISGGTPTPTPTPAPTPAPDSDIVTFNDAGAEAMVRIALNGYSGDVTVGMMKGITELSCTNLATDVNDISVFRYCTNLEYIQLWDLSVGSLEALRGLTKLEEVVLKHCHQISDLSPLSGKPSLKKVFIHDCPVVDASPVLSLPSLQEFVAEIGTHINDISALRNTSGLRKFYSYNTLLDPSPLFGHTNLTRIRLDGLDSYHFREFAKRFGRLESMVIYNCPITSDDLNLLSSRSLYQLWLTNSYIDDVSSLANQHGLMDLDLRGARITDVTPLATITSMKSLFLCGNPIVKAAPLSTLKNLNFLFLPTSVTDADALRNALPGCEITLK